MCDEFPAKQTKQNTRKRIAQPLGGICWFPTHLEFISTLGWLFTWASCACNVYALLIYLAHFISSLSAHSGDFTGLMIGKWEPARGCRTPQKHRLGMALVQTILCAKITEALSVSACGCPTLTVNGRELILQLLKACWCLLSWPTPHCLFYLISVCFYMVPGEVFSWIWSPSFQEDRGSEKKVFSKWKPIDLLLF